MTQKFVSRENDMVFFQKYGRIIPLNIRDIIYVEHRSRTIFVHTINGVFLMPYMSLCKIHERLGNDFLFQCHKSYLVNRMYVEQFVCSENLIVLKNYFGNIAVGRHYRKSFLENMHYI